MAILPTNSTSLDLTISVPGFSSSSSGEEKGGGHGVVTRNFDINQVPSDEELWPTTAVVSMEEDGRAAGGEGEEIDEEESGGSGTAAAAAANGGGDPVPPPSKKLRLTKEQSRLLEESFRQNHTLNPKQKEELATKLTLKPRQVEVWFQNRRARSKLKQTEMECEYLKRWFGSLSEQNKKLHREVEELRAMRVFPPTVLSPHGCEPLGASALTMCPRCERVTTTATSSVATTGYENGIRSSVTTMARPTALSAEGSLPVFTSRQPPTAC